MCVCVCGCGGGVAALVARLVGSHFQTYNHACFLIAQVAAITDLMTTEFREPPKVLNFQIHVAGAAGVQINVVKGQLRAVSPCEPRHALIKALARDIRNKVSDEDFGTY